MFKGKFITIEGCEGTGKSTQIKLLEKNLKKKIKIKSTREPGGSFGFTSQPLIRSISNSDSYDSLTFYQTNHALTSSMKNVQGGNYIIDTRNQGGKDISLDVYSIRIGFSGDCSSYQIRQYYSQNWNFVPNEYLFTPDEGLVLDKHFGKGDAEEDIVYYQTSAFDFRILERTINVNVNLR